jgi:cation diffusion facilitator family transporter
MSEQRRTDEIQPVTSQSVQTVNLIHNPDQQKASDLRQARSKRAVSLGLAVNICLALVKTSIGIIGHSPALLAEGVNSTSDVAYYLVVAIFMRLSHKPADELHPYGHNQLESIASLIVGAFIVTTGIAVFWDSINTAFDQLFAGTQTTGASAAALWVALFTVAIKVFLYYYTRVLGRQTSNPAVMALAYDHRNDILSASAAAIGIYLGRTGYPWLDPLVGALVAILILRTGVEVLRESSADLMDAVPSQALTEQVSALLSSIDEVKSLEEVHAHRFGPYIVVNLTIGVEGEMSVAAGDCISTEVENLIYENIDLVRRVYVHYHPVTYPEPCRTAV